MTVSVSEPRAYRRRECVECQGTGRKQLGALLPYECDECNGTGIRGDVRLGALVLLAYTVGMVLLVGWFFIPGH